MPDLLVKLYELPPLETPKQQGVEIRRAIAPEKHLVVNFAREHFSESWASEVEVGFGHVPVGVWVAVKDERCVGFACYDITMRGFFGPVGVDETERGQGIGAALSLSVLHAMKSDGYGYAIIGWAGPVDFYARLCGATVIENSEPGVYRGMLKAPPAT